jgi:AcrR family transcriptional regulator
VPDDLRSRLIDAGVELLERDGLAAVTLRAIAREAGVSHGAPRRWFATRAELLSHVAGHGFALLAELTAPALDTPGLSPRERLRAGARAYADFGEQHPGLFMLMARHDLLESEEQRLRQTSLAFFGQFVRLTAEAQADGWRPGVEPRLLAASLWAAVHGVVHTRLTGALELVAGAADDVLDLTLDGLLG